MKRLVPRAGIEPARPRGRRILSAATHVASAKISALRALFVSQKPTCVPGGAHFRAHVLIALATAALLSLPGCGQIPCEVAPGFPMCAGELRQPIPGKPVKWNRLKRCTRKGDTLFCTV